MWLTITRCFFVSLMFLSIFFFFFFQAEDGIRDVAVTGVQTCALPIYHRSPGDECGGSPRGPASRGVRVRLPRGGCRNASRAPPRARCARGARGAHGAGHAPPVHRGCDPHPPHHPLLAAWHLAIPARARAAPWAVAPAPAV